MGRNLCSFAVAALLLIASPGLASLKAALSPAHANYLFYLVTDCQGHTSFTASYAEFQRFLANRPAC